MFTRPKESGTRLEFVVRENAHCFIDCFLHFLLSMCMAIFPPVSPVSPLTLPIAHCMISDSGWFCFACHSCCSGQALLYLLPCAIVAVTLRNNLARDAR
jgi:hypothetical protein